MSLFAQLRVVTSFLLQKAPSWRRASVLIALLGGTSGTGCLGGLDECTPYEVRCDGTVLEECQPPCSDIGCGSTWERTPCGGACVEVGDGAACVDSASPDPRCGGKDGYCDGSVVVDCWNGFVLSRHDCNPAASNIPGAADAGTVNAQPQLTCLAQPPGDGPACAADICSGNVVACNAPSRCGPTVHGVERQGAAPAPQGGIIEDGTYVLQALNVYGESPGTEVGDFQITRLFDRGTFATTVYPSADSPAQSGSYTIRGTDLVWTQSCPSANSVTFGYTATSTMLTLYDVRGAVVFETIHTKL